jgi:hypothetical protein
MLHTVPSLQSEKDDPSDHATTMQQMRSNRCCWHLSEQSHSHLHLQEQMWGAAFMVHTTAEYMAVIASTIKQHVKRDTNHCFHNSLWLQ